MPELAYINKRFNDSTLDLIMHARVICKEYEDQGFVLTLRQLYYQFVARGLLPNEQRQYKRLGSAVSDARMAGLLDWNAIEDRTRNLKSNPHWDSPRDILEACASQFAIDKWETQPCRVEVWIEKDALTGVIDPICKRLDIPYFACRGYTSQSEQWRAGQRFLAYEDSDQDCVVLHLGDHDPSGIDMTRDNQDRLNVFGSRVDVRRIALNLDQIHEYDPPPNPAKLTDSRAGDYINRFGYKSWELDALSPTVIEALIQEQVDDILDPDAWDMAEERELNMVARLKATAENWED